MDRHGKSQGSAVVEYETIWRNKWLTADATSIEDMVRMLREAADTLQELADAGLVLDGDCGDDYARLYTTNPQVAKKLRLHKTEL